MDGDYNDNNNNSDYPRDNDYYELDYETHDVDSKGLTISPRLLETTSRWSGILGIITIISGVITCLGAFTTFGLALIPGIINIILGLKLNNVKKSIQSYLRGDSYAINETFDHLGKYFKIQGILMIVGIIIAILMIIVAVVFGIATFTQMGPEMMY